MTVRAHTVGTELCPEGVEVLFKEANGYATFLDEAGEVAVNLYEIWTDEETGKTKRRIAGTLAAGRWAAVVTVDDEVVTPA
jgi:hypothetical protein